MNENKEKVENKVTEKIMQQIDKKLEELTKAGIQQTNVDYVYKLIDIKKDIKGMEENEMMYRGDYGRGMYGNFDNYRGRDSMGRYSESGNYGRRGYDNKYRGEEALDEMKYHYGNYHDSNSYGAKEDSSYKMIECFKDFGYSIAEELEPKDKQMLKKAMQDVMMELDK